MKIILYILLLAAMSAPVLAEESEYQALLDDIVATHIPSPENEAKLIALFDHPDMGVRVSAKFRIAELYWKNGRFEQAEAALQDVTESFDDLTPKYQVETLLNWALLERRRNNFKEVERYVRQASEVAKNGYKKLLPNTYYMLGNALLLQIKFSQAKRYFELALEIYRKEGNDNGDLVNGIKYLSMARKAVERTNSKGHRASTYYNLADIYLKSGEPSVAAGYYQQALELDLELKDLGNAAYDYNGLAAAFIASNQYTKALQNNQQAIQLLLKVSAPQQLSSTYLKQAEIYDKLDEQEKRLKSLLLAQRSAAEADSSYQTMSVQIAKAEYYLTLKKAEQARSELSAALEIANQLSLQSELIKLNKLLATTYKQLSEHHKAYQYLNQSYELPQKLNTEDRREKSERFSRLEPPW